MINYEGWGRPPDRPKRRGGKTAAAVGALCMVITIVLLAGRSLLTNHTAAPTPGGSGQSAIDTDLSTGREWALGACIDPTTVADPVVRPDDPYRPGSRRPPTWPLQPPRSDTSAQPGKPVSPPQDGDQPDGPRGRHDLLLKHHGSLHA